MHGWLQALGLLSSVLRSEGRGLSVPCATVLAPRPQDPDESLGQFVPHAGCGRGLPGVGHRVASCTPGLQPFVSQGIPPASGIQVRLGSQESLEGIKECYPLVHPERQVLIISVLHAPHLSAPPVPGAALAESSQLALLEFPFCLCLGVVEELPHASASLVGASPWDCCCGFCSSGGQPHVSIYLWI